MARVEVYTTASCPYCVRAKRLLQARNIAYEEIDVGGNAELRTEIMVKSGGRRTVPQIFIDGQPIGGFDELHELETTGRLDELIAAPAS